MAKEAPRCLRNGGITLSKGYQPGWEYQTLQS